MANGMRECIKCGPVPEEHFYKGRNTCNYCLSDYQRARRKKQKMSDISYLLNNWPRATG